MHTYNICAIYPYYFIGLIGESERRQRGEFIVDVREQHEMEEYLLHVVLKDCQACTFFPNIRDDNRIDWCVPENRRLRFEEGVQHSLRWCVVVVVVVSWGNWTYNLLTQILRSVDELQWSYRQAHKVIAEGLLDSRFEYAFVDIDVAWVDSNYKNQCFFQAD